MEASTFDPKSGDVFIADTQNYRLLPKQGDLKRGKIWSTSLHFKKVYKTRNKKKGTVFVEIQYSREDCPKQNTVQYAILHYDNIIKTAKMYEHPYQETKGECDKIIPKQSIGLDKTEFIITPKQNLRAIFFSHKDEKLYMYKALFKKKQ